MNLKKTVIHYIFFNTVFILSIILLNKILNIFKIENFLFKEIILFIFIWIILSVQNSEFLVVGFLSISNLLLFLIIVWVINRSVSLDILSLIDNEIILNTTSDLLQDKLDYHLELRILQAKESGFIKQINSNLNITETGKKFLNLLNFVKTIFS